MKTNFLTAREEHTLLIEACNGNVEGRNKVIINVYSLICGIVNKHCAQSMNDREDAAQFVFTRLCEKFHKFEPHRGVRYMTYAKFWVRQALQEYWRKKGFIHSTNGKRVIVKSLNTNDDNGQGMLEIVCDHFPNPYDHLEDHDNANNLERILSLLESRERLIVTRRSKGEKLQRIADSLELSKERVRQIECSAILKMRSEFAKLDSMV